MREAAIVRFVKGLVNSWDARRSSCLARLVIGLMRGGRLGVAAIGRHVRTKTTDKHHIKSVDRFLGNQALDLSVLWRSLAALASSQRPRLFVLLDWTDLHHDKLEALVAAVSYGGRALPIAWATTRKGIYERSRNLFETNFCRLLKTLVPDTVELVIVADRGFGRASLFRALRKAGIHFIVRIRKDVHLIDLRGHGPLRNRRIKRGQTRDLPNSLYGDDARAPVRAVITFGLATGSKQPKQPWYLATDIPPDELAACSIVAAYKLRMRIEHNFRDHKSMRYGFQLRSVRLSTLERYDRLFAIASLALLMLVLIGAQAERRHLNQTFRANTSTVRTHSLFTIGLALVHRPALGPPRLSLVLACFDPLLEGMG